MGIWRRGSLVTLVVTVLCLASLSQGKDWLDCWQCSNYDPKGTYYDQCPMDDKVDPERAYLGNCTGKCFIHTDDRNDKLVYRGCTGTQYGLPKPLPPDGCYPWYSEVWCVCSTDGCNGVALGEPKSDKQFDAHIDYSKPQSEDGTGGAGPTLMVSPTTFTLTLLLSSFGMKLWK